MRTTAATAAIFLAFILAGCGQGGQNGESGQSAAATSQFNQAFEGSFRDSYRRSGIEGCVRGAQARAPGRNVDFGPVCTCFIDRIMAGRTAAELMNLRQGPQAQAAVQQCARELGVGAAGGGAGGGAGGTADDGAGGGKP